MRIVNLHLKNFRCFKDKIFDLDEKIIVLQGKNGSGKTSILESLYVSCYLRSFRTHLAHDIITFDTDAFFIKLELKDTKKENNNHQIVLGYSKDKKVIKIDQSVTSSFKKLFEYHRVISITEDDLFLIQGSPQYRRSFIDQTISLLEPECIKEAQAFKSAQQQRNALLKTGNISDESYDLWTKQLFEKTKIIQNKRKKILQQLEIKVNLFLKKHFTKDLSISLLYDAAKQSDVSFETFEKNVIFFKNDELRYKRSLFGAHLDDIRIEYQQRYSRSYASRGQQKLVLLLLKIAQMQLIEQKRGSVLLLLDDFLTDFDQERIEILLTLLCGLDNQLIITTPIKNDMLNNFLQNKSCPYKIIVL